MYRIYPINAIIIIIYILHFSFSSGAKLLCKFTPTTSIHISVYGLCHFLKTFF